MRTAKLSVMKSCSTCCGFDYTVEYELSSWTTANGIIPVSKYISRSTGLTVVHAEVDGPLVHGYICVATRAEDSDGLPHALEHMVFLGSEDYPYSGVLDRVANKCLASGTNAWTDVDHTCFSFSTAGSDGFCQLLPIFLDHIFYPLLADYAFETEVHHVTGRGIDGGLIYTEMQTLENTGYNRATNELFRTVYPPESGYHWNVGGSMQNLRESCTNEKKYKHEKFMGKVRAFHKKYYHARNTCLIVCGVVDLQQLFGAIQPMIKKMLERDMSSNLAGRCERPWLTEDLVPIPDVPSPITKTVQFPTFDEDGAGDLVLVGFLGPPIVSSEPTEEHFNMEEAIAVLLLLQYLSKSTVAPLRQDLEGKENYSLVTNLNFTFGEYSRPLVFFELDGVADKPKAVSQLRKSLESQLENFDISHMETTLHWSIQSEFAALENFPHVYVAQAVTRDFLYGVSPSTFTNRLNSITTISNFLQKPASFWTDLIQTHILAPNWVTICAEPSISLQKELWTQEEDRIVARREILGSGGLASNAIRLDQAFLYNSKSIPKKILRKVKVPSLKKIQFHQIERIRNPTWIFTSEFPANIFLDDICTNFFYVAVLMDTTTLGGEFRQYLPLFAEVLLHSPMLKITEGYKKVIIPCEQVVADRERDLLICELNLGLENLGKSEDDDGASFMTRFSCGSYSHLLTLGLQMELGKVEEGMDWIRKMFWTTHWDMERVKIAVDKLLGDVLQVRRSACQMCSVILKHLIYQEDSNVTKMSPLTQLKLLQDIYPDDDAKFALSENEIRTAFDSILSVATDPSNVSLHLSGNIKKVRDNLNGRPMESLGNLLLNSFPFEHSTTKVEKRISNAPDTVWIPSSQKLEARSLQCQIIFGLGSADSAYLSMVGPGPTSYEDPDLPGILTAIQYFTQTEGPLHHSIRGYGFALWYKLVVKVSEGLIYFELSQCSDVVGAYYVYQAGSTLS